MKKIFSFILSLCVVLTTTAVATSARDKCDMSFAVASDLHYSAPKEELKKPMMTLFIGTR